MDKTSKRLNEDAKYVLAERTIRILEVLKKYTDENHTLKQNEIREKLGKNEMGNPRTFADTINKIMYALNPVVFDGENENEFHITHKALEEDFLLAKSNPELFEANLDEKCEGAEKKPKISELRYIHPLSYAELDEVINSMYFSKSMTEEERDALILKLADLSSDYYKRRWINMNNNEKSVKKIVKGIVDNGVLLETDLSKNLKVVRQAIEKNMKIQFHFNSYGSDKKLHPKLNKDKKVVEYVVTPYHIVAYNGRYYVIANTEPYDNYSIYRIDLMTDLHMAKDGNDNNVQGRPAREIENLPDKWDERNFSQQLYMYYDEPVNVTLKIENDRYTVLADYFGAQYNKLESLDKKHDKVLVTTSPKAIVAWVLQYSDIVEVISPEEVRDAVKEKIKALNIKYDIE